jgi:plastocyanin
MPRRASYRPEWAFILTLDGNNGCIYTCSHPASRPVSQTTSESSQTCSPQITSIPSYILPPKMYTSTLLLSLLPVALAQYGGGGSSPSPSPSSASSTAAAAPATKTAAVPNGVQVVMVSNPQGDLQFTPNSFNASVGSTVEFQFYPPTHSISQAAFDSPCTPLNNTGFFSGGVTTTGSGPNAAQAYSITINDTTPIWFYCSFPTHCETGMVGVINPP